MAFALWAGHGRIVVGVEDDRETGGVRVYIDSRYLNRYSLICDREVAAAVRRQWLGSRSQHLVADFQDLWPIHDEGRAA